jgi:hypothetical protein
MTTEYYDADELEDGRLCEEGLMKETYQDGELKRFVTAMGKLECSKMLKEKKYQDFVLDFVQNFLEQHPDRKEDILKGFQNFLKECGYGMEKI